MKKNMVTATRLVTSLPMFRSDKQPTSDDRKSIGNLKHQLIERKELHFRCRRVNNIMCIIALFGLVLMIIDTEFGLNKLNAIIMILIRSLISISTLILLCLVLYYHTLNIRLYAINNHIADWRVTVTIRVIVLIIFEVVICAIHPFPYKLKRSSNDSSSVEMFLTLPMFARLYLIARSMTVHSPLVNAASCRTIGYLNRVPITISFILRAFLQTYPAVSWSCVMFTMLLIASWSLHACEKGMWLPINSSPLELPASASTFSNSVWFTVVTFTTVGYGDVIPQTYCGQGVSIITSFFGLFASVVLIAVFTNKISLNRSEQVVLDFVNHINRARAYKDKTMKIIQYSVRAWFLKRNGHHFKATFNSLYRLHTAIQQARIIKQEQRNAINGNESLMTILNDVHDEQKSNDKTLGKFKQQIGQLEDKINRLETKLDTVVNILTYNDRIKQHTLL